MRKQIAWGSLVVTLLIWPTAPAQALELIWTAPDTCSSDAFEQHLTDTTEKPIADLPDVKLRVAVTRTPNETQPWRARFVLESSPETRSPEREIDGQSCNDVSRVAAVAVAVALFEKPTEPTGPTAETNTTATQVQTTTTAARSPSAVSPGHRAEKPRTWRWLLSGGAGGDTALYGNPTYTLGLGFGVASEAWEVHLDVTRFGTTTLRASDTVGIRLWGYSAEALGCWVVVPSPSRPSLCLGYTVDQINGEGEGDGLRVRREQSAYWSALHPHAALSVPLTEAFTLRLNAGAAIGLVGATFVYDAGREAHTLPRLTLRGAAALVWMF